MAMLSSSLTACLLIHNVTALSGKQLETFGAYSFEICCFFSMLFSLLTLFVVIVAILEMK